MRLSYKGFIFILLVLNSVIGAAQKGKITGKVSDAATGEVLIGVAVYLDGTTTGNTTDLDGKFTIQNVAPGTYTIGARYVSFKTKMIEGVTVNADQSTELNIVLESNTTELSEFVVITTLSREMSSVLLMEQKNAPMISDGISADAIKRSPDSNTGEVLKRVSGASIQDNKFAIIRGLNDRYNQALLNGAPLPSSEPDKKAFAFDIFPSNLIDNMVISKTSTPDVSGDVAGGTIAINTKDIPEDNFYSFSISGNYHSLTTGKSFYEYEHGKNDYFGLDDGKRADVLDIFPSSDVYRSMLKGQKLPISKQLDNSWAINNSRKALPAQGFQAVAGNKVNLFGNELGSIFAITYSNSYVMQPVTRRDFDKNLIFELKDSVYKFSVLAGALWNLSYKIGDNHKISFKNIFNINSEDQTVTRKGFDVQQGNKIRAYAMYYQQNVMLSNQLSGEHFFPKTKLKLTWIGGHSDVERIVPNFRRIRYIKGIDDTTDRAYQAVIGSTASPNDAGMFFSTLNEKIYSGRIDLKIPVEKLKGSIKTGGAMQLRERDFHARLLGYVRYGGNFQNNLLYQPVDSIFDTTNVSKKGFLVDDQTSAPDKYTASSRLNAGYIMFDNLIAKKFRAVWGLRVEQFNQRLNSKTQAQDTVEINTTIIDILPSLNVTWSLTEKTNLRWSVSRTVNRPEFRELAPFSFFDFNQFLTVAGNPDLQRASILNFDMRYEFYPNIGEVFSATVFYKDFTNPIEQILNPGIGGGTRVISYRNIDKARNYGLEFEARKNFSWLSGNDTSWLKDLSFVFNLALIKSEVDLSKVVGAISSTRPLQGQSPYVLNTGLTYFNAEKGWGVSLMYNQIGRRLFAVGNVDYRDVFENPRPVFDAQISKRLGKFEIKANVSDILARNLIFYQDLNSDKKYDLKDQVLYDYTFGRSVGLSVSFRF